MGGFTMKNIIEWFSADGRRLIAVAIIFATLLGAWMFRYEANGVFHRNRFTGAICELRHECWFQNEPYMR
jgi:hypothetical protein